MDTQNEVRIAKCGSLAEIAGKTVVVGAKQLRKAIRDGRVLKAFIAMNADPALTAPIEALCRQNQIPYTWAKTMMDLGAACGIEVGAATAAVVES